MSYRSVKPRTATSPPRSAERAAATTDVLPAFVTDTLWPVVVAAFRDVDLRTNARFFQFDEFQVVISRLPARGITSRDSEQKVTLEIWPARGPRLLVVDWSGRCPHVVHWRDGDWLNRLPHISLQPEAVAW